MSREYKFVLLGGPTGCGKTELLHDLVADGEQVLDLEGMAHHKGSAFGWLGEKPQPSTEHFMNLLYDTLCRFDTSRAIFSEDESISIGRVKVPHPFFIRLKASPYVRVVADEEDRLDRIMVHYGDTGQEGLIESFQKIQKRLGDKLMNEAINLINEGNVREAARIGLGYYDKCYRRQDPSVYPDYVEMTHSAKLTAETIEKLKQYARSIEL